MNEWMPLESLAVRVKLSAFGLRYFGMVTPIAFLSVVHCASTEELSNPRFFSLMVKKRTSLRMLMTYTDAVERHGEPYEKCAGATRIDSSVGRVLIGLALRHGGDALRDVQHHQAPANEECVISSTSQRAGHASWRGPVCGVVERMGVAHVGRHVYDMRIGDGAPWPRPEMMTASRPWTSNRRQAARILQSISRRSSLWRAPPRLPLHFGLLSKPPSPSVCLRFRPCGCTTAAARDDVTAKGENPALPRETTSSSYFGL